MTMTARESYLTTQVMTATPQKLQLLLIDAAIRSAQSGQRHWAEDNEEAACDALGHAVEVVAELLASVGSAKSDISRRLAGIYIYLFRSLSDAQLQRDEQKLADALRVLLIERETWSMVCEKFGTTQTEGSASSSMDDDRNASSREDSNLHTSSPTSITIDAQHATPATMMPRRSLPVRFVADSMPASAGGISFEA